jgi:hypothetical protein
MRSFDLPVFNHIVNTIAKTMPTSSNPISKPRKNVLHVNVQILPAVRLEKEAQPKLIILMEWLLLQLPEKITFAC